MVQNHHLAKSISDASWSLFTDWVDYYSKVFGTWAIAVAPHYTSQDCSVCGTRVKKSLSTRTHKCYVCGTTMHRNTFRLRGKGEWERENKKPLTLTL